MIDVFPAFPVLPVEYDELETKLGKLCYKIAWVLRSQNYNNNVVEEIEDTVQQLRIDMMRAASYYKRQTYILNCFAALRLYTKDRFTKRIVEALEELWSQKTRHGANRQKFGLLQEVILDRLVRKHVPKDARPNKKARLTIDHDFKVYAKQILWNSERSMGKKITKEKSIRDGLVSLSEFDYLGAMN